MRNISTAKNFCSRVGEEVL